MVPEIYTPDALIKVKELLAILDPYADNWQCWIQSDECFLSERDIDVLCYFLMTGSHEVAMAELKITEWEAIQILQNVATLLQHHFPLFKQWLVKSNLSQFR